MRFMPPVNTVFESALPWDEEAENETSGPKLQSCAKYSEDVCISSGTCIRWWGIGG